MTTDHFADPEADGIPGYADDDSSADPVRDAARVADGPSPAALPADRPLGATEFGTTANEQRDGEPLDDRLRREQPDVTDVLDGPRVTDPLDATRELDAEDLAREIDGEALPAEDAETAAALDGLDPRVDSPVSVYDGAGADFPGLLVEPDEGAHSDVDAEAVAEERGFGGGSPEEQAVHVIRDTP